eukprot:GHRR01000059.1.p1 GENE.GHRR01000059.1~~GHRR01000059.1.p1  ORF type:complete len:3021 (+),score=-229.54 GHRR01000059.1:1182-10244(+)
MGKFSKKKNFYSFFPKAKFSNILSDHTTPGAIAFALEQNASAGSVGRAKAPQPRGTSVHMIHYYRHRNFVLGWFWKKEAPSSNSTSLEVKVRIQSNSLRKTDFLLMHMTPNQISALQQSAKAHENLNSPFSTTFFDRDSFLVFSKKKPTKQLFSAYKILAHAELGLSNPLFLNFSFDKSRLKSVVSWFFEKYGQYKTIQLLEKLKEFGFSYATNAGISLGIDDLKIPKRKVALVSKAETKVAKDLMDYRNAKITGVERTQRLIYTWNQTNDMLKQEVLKYFETTDLFNPIYMMAFSGARGNMSQVRQLVGMRGLMSDPQGQIIDFPIQSNFREGLTLTEYLISTYGARKGIVDTALRTATAGYLTRRLVDVAQHVIVSQFDCGTMRGIFLFDMKEANKTIYSFESRLVGRVLAQDIKYGTNFVFGESKSTVPQTRVAFQNQEVDSTLATAIAKVTKKALVRSPLTCQTPRLICQLCYGWSLSQGKLVSVGEAVGVIAAQSIGEPGTQLTMRTFHTGGVFAGGLTDQILAPFDGKIRYFQNIPGSCIRTSLSEIAFFTKMPGSFCVEKTDSVDLKWEENQPFQNAELRKTKQHFRAFKKVNQHHFSEIYNIPAYAVLFLRNNEFVCKKQVLAQFSTVAKKQLQFGSAEQTLYSSLAGEFYLNGSSQPFSLVRFQKEHFEQSPIIQIQSKSFDLRSVQQSGAELKSYLEQAHMTIATNQKNRFVEFVSTLPTQKIQKTIKKKVGKIDLLVEKRNAEDLSLLERKNDILWKSKNWTNIWILAGKVLYNYFEDNLFIQQGDFVKNTSVLSQIFWTKPKRCSIDFHIQTKKNSTHTKKRGNMFYFMAFEKKQHSAQNKNDLKKNCFRFVAPFPQKNNVECQHFSEPFDKNGSTATNILFSPFSFEISKHNTKKQKKKFPKTKMWKNVILPHTPFSNPLISKFVHADPKFRLKQHLVHRVKFLPFLPFSANLLNSYKKQHFKNKKFLKTKKDIIFSGNFQRCFRFFARRAKKQKHIENNNLKIHSFRTIKSLHTQTKNLNTGFVNYSQRRQQQRDQQKKNLIKQIFFKFSTFGTTSRFFRVYNFTTIFNSSQKFIKRKTSTLCVLTPKKVKISQFSIFHKRFELRCHQSSRPFESFLDVDSILKNNKTKDQTIFHFLYKVSQNKIKFMRRVKTIQKKQLIYSAFSLWSFPFFSSLNPERKITSFKISKSRGQFGHTKSFQKQILWKKNMFCIQFEKVRYKKFGYVFSFVAPLWFSNVDESFGKGLRAHRALNVRFDNSFLSKQHQGKISRFKQRTENTSSSQRNFQQDFIGSVEHLNWTKKRFFQCSFRFFNSLKQPTLNFYKIANPGKQEKGISISNENFFGKNFPTFVSYCFPKNYQTVTNGIFTILSFQNISKTKRLNKFLCSKENFLSFLQYSFADKIYSFLTVEQKRKKKKNFKKFFHSHKKVFFLTINSFEFIQHNNSLLASVLKVHKTINRRLPAQFNENVEAKKIESFPIHPFMKIYKNKFPKINFEKIFKILLYFDSKKAETFLNIQHAGYQKNTQKKKFYNDFSFSVKKGERFFLPFSSSFLALNCFNFFLNKQKIKTKFNGQTINFQKTFEFCFPHPPNSELYTKEIFWLPQENYNFSILHFSMPYTTKNEKLFVFMSGRQKRDFLKKKSKPSAKKLLVSQGSWQPLQKNKRYLSETVLTPTGVNLNLFAINNIKTKIASPRNKEAKIPFIYLSNRQGKKTIFFSNLEGICNWSVLKNFNKASPIFRQSFRSLPKSYFFQKNGKTQKIKKFVPTRFVSNHCIVNKFGWIQQKLSFLPNSLKKNKNLFNLSSKVQKNKILSGFSTQSNGNHKTALRQTHMNLTTTPQLNKRKSGKNLKKLNFLKTQFFLKKKNRRFLNFSSKTYYGKKFIKKFKKNFCCGFSHVQPNITHSGKFAPIGFLDQCESLVKDEPGLGVSALDANHWFYTAVPGIRSRFKSTQKKLQNNSFENIKKLFCDQSFDFSFQKLSKIQTKIGKISKNQCFTCIPLQKNTVSDSTTTKKSIERKGGYFHKANTRQNGASFFPQKKGTYSFENRRVQVKIQPGWIYFVPQFCLSSDWHQSVEHYGHFFGKDLCFEQNKILRETRIVDSSSFTTFVASESQRYLNENFHSTNFENSANVHLVDQAKPYFHIYNHKLTQNTNQIDSNFDSQNKNLPSFDIQKNNSQKLTFVVHSFQQKEKCRFSNQGAIYAIQNLCSTLPGGQFSHKKMGTSDTSTFVQVEKVNLNEQQTTSNNVNFPQSFKLKQKKIFCLFFQPMHYKVLENPKNYKNFYQTLTFQHFCRNLTSIDVGSSAFTKSAIKIYKKYHSNLLNLQKPEKVFQQNIGNFHLDFRSVFPLNSNHVPLGSSKYDLWAKAVVTKTVQKFQKNQQSKLFQTHKKEKNKNFLNIKQYSKKNIVRKFKNLLNRNISTTNYYFSFYPIQFLPLEISKSSFTLSRLVDRKSRNLPMFVVNSVNNTLDFSMYEKKASFLNQRFICFNVLKDLSQSSSFWSNKDSTHGIFSAFVEKTNQRQVLNSQNANRKNKKKKELFQNFFVEKNPFFYANTKFLSPFEGELVSMITNETNWWKKASEISTIKKLHTLFSVLTKKDFFSIGFISKKNIQKIPCSPEETPDSIPNPINQKKLKYFLKNKQKNLFELYQFVLKTHTNMNSFALFQNTQKTLKNRETFDLNWSKQDHNIDFSNGKESEIKPSWRNFFVQDLQKNTQKVDVSSFVTKYENKIYTLKKLTIGYPTLSKKPQLGKFFVYGDCFLNIAIQKPGQIIHLSSSKITLRHAQPFLVSPKGILHLSNTPYIEKNIPILTLPYQTVQSGDIVQGIPKVEQLFEARTTVNGRLFLSSVPILLKGIFERYKAMLPLEQAVQQSFLKIQQLIVDGVQRVYRSQGVSIVDKHLEVVVRQMTTKVQIIHGAQTGFFPGELVNLHLVERINKFLMVKIRYEPVVLGITRASLEVDSFLSASSFQQTTKILALAAISRKKDFLKGLKENILVGNLIPSGTGYMVLSKTL